MKMERDWVKVYSTKMAHRAEIVKAVLADHDINSVDINKQDSSYLIFGEIEVYVNKEHETLSKYLIKENNL